MRRSVASLVTKFGLREDRRTSEDGRLEKLYELVDLNERVDGHFKISAIAISS
jgi:hypothetical protein